MIDLDDFTIQFKKYAAMVDREGCDKWEVRIPNKAYRDILHYKNPAQIRCYSIGEDKWVWWLYAKIFNEAFGFSDEDYKNGFSWVFNECFSQNITLVKEEKYICLDTDAPYTQKNKREYLKLGVDYSHILHHEDPINPVYFSPYNGIPDHVKDDATQVCANLINFCLNKFV